MNEVFLLEPKNEQKIPAILIFAESEQCARINACVPTLAQKRDHGISPEDIKPYENDKNASCRQLAAGKDYTLISKEDNEIDFIYGQCTVNLSNRGDNYNIFFSFNGFENGQYDF